MKIKTYNNTYKDSDVVNNITNFGQSKMEMFANKAVSDYSFMINQRDQKVDMYYDVTLNTMAYECHRSSHDEKY